MLAEIHEALGRSGLSLRGGFHVTPDDRASWPQLGQASTVLLIGNLGGGFWPIFERWRLAHRDIANPLDTWSRAVISEVAQACGARAASPSDRPFLPFQQWAVRAEGLKPSPLGILMHPDYGLWQAYRGALLFDRQIDLPEVEKPIHLCDACVEKPCKKACPVDAHAGDGFAYETCLAHLRREPSGPCMCAGCLDRNACPYGAAHRYPAAMQALFANAFVSR